MIYKYVPLAELGEIVAGSTPDTFVKEYWGGDIPWITPADLTDHQGIFFNGKLRKITDAGYRSCSTRMLPPGSILYSSRAPIGHCAVTAYPLCTNQGFKSIIPNERLDAVYGYFALKHLTPKIENLGRGATFTEVNKEIFGTISIPLPPLSEQRRIAAILGKADRVRRLRRMARALGETYLQAVFVEMFGDVALNPMKWKVESLVNLCTNVTDGTHDTPERMPVGVPFITSKNVRPYEIDLTNLEYVSMETHQEIIKRCNPRWGDILYTNIGVNVGNAVANRLGFSFSLKNVALFQLNIAKLNPYYMESLLNNPGFKESRLQLSSVGGAQKFMSLDVLREMPIPTPPLDLQGRFAGIVQRYERLRAQQREGEWQAEMLFQGLLEGAFGGEG